MFRAQTHTLHAKFYCSYRYANSKVPPTSVDAQLGVGSASASPNAACASYAVDDESATSHLAKEELNLLAKLIGTETDARRRDTFRLNIFDGDHGDEEVDDGDHRRAGGEDKTLSIDLKTGRSRGELDRIISEMTVEEAAEEDEDILALMDKAT